MSREALADISFPASLATWLIAHALQWMPLLQALSFIAVCISAICASAYHLKQTFGKRERP